MIRVSVISVFALCLSMTAASAGVKNLPAGMVMVDIPGGTFEMGSTGETVTVGDFKMSETEVTWSQYCKFLNNKKPKDAKRKKWITLLGEDNSSHIYKEGGVYYVDIGWADHPVVNVSVAGAIYFCNYYGLRLPKETEWEYAAGGSNHTKYPWGDEFDGTKCCYKENRGDGNPKTMPVKSFAANGYGLYDMAGNAAEWCAGSEYVVRGGSWKLGPNGVRCAFIGGDDSDFGGVISGFRAAGD
jgi:sulfatase modifying factor 1